MRVPRDAPGRNRTCDLSLRRRTLYPLSYGRGQVTSVAPVKLTARIATLRLAGDVHDLAQLGGRGGGRAGRGRARRRVRVRRGGADRALRRVGRSPRSPGSTGSSSATTPSRSTRSPTGCRPASTRRARRVDAALHDLQGKLTGLPVYKLLGLRRAGPPTSWTIWLGDPDDMARRTEKIADARVQAAEAEARRPRRARRRARARRSRGDRPAAAVRRQRGVVARRGARVLPQLRPPVLRAAAARRRSGRAGAEAALADSRSTSTRTATRSPTSPPAPSARTGSTSSSRSPAASAKRCGWCTPPARSGSA